MIRPARQWLLRDLRTSFRLSQQSFAERAGAGLSQVRISLLELGQATPTERERQAILNAVSLLCAGRCLEELVRRVAWPPQK